MSATVWQALRASASPTGETDGRVPFPAPETAPQDQAARLRSRGQRGASAVQRPEPPAQLCAEQDFPRLCGPSWGRRRHEVIGGDMLTRGGRAFQAGREELARGVHSAGRHPGSSPPRGARGHKLERASDRQILAGSGCAKEKTPPGAAGGVASRFLRGGMISGESQGNVWARESGRERIFRSNSRFSRMHPGLPNSSLTAPHIPHLPGTSEREVIWT